MTALQRQSYNVLLKNAYSELMKKDVHRISISDISLALGLNSQNMDVIKDALRVLNATQMEWNMLGQDRKNEWGVTTALAGVKIRRGVCEYSYSPQLREFLYQPNIYARLNLVIQRGIKSKHTQVLWEYLIAAISAVKRPEIFTEWISIPDYLILFGFNDSDYSAFKYINRDLIKAPLRELNESTDINAAAEYKKEGRRTAAVRFHVTRKEQSQLPFQYEDETQGAIAVTSPETHAETAKTLSILGVGIKTAMALVNKFGEKKVVFQMEHYEYLVSINRKPTNPAGWLIKAIENEDSDLGYLPPEGFVTREERDIKRRKQKFLEDAQRFLDHADYDNAITLAQQRLALGPNKKAEQIIADAKKRLMEKFQDRIAEAYLKQLRPDQVQKLEGQAGDDLKNESEMAAQFYKDEGKESLFFKLKFRELLLKDAEEKGFRIDK